MSADGRHLLLDAWGIAADLLCDPDRWEQFFASAVAATGATQAAPPTQIWFDNGGMTAFVVLTESHLSVHTWPEEGRCAVDCYTCGAADPAAVEGVFKHLFVPKVMRTRLVHRGEE